MISLLQKNGRFLSPSPIGTKTTLQIPRLKPGTMPFLPWGSGDIAPKWCSLEDGCGKTTHFGGHYLVHFIPRIASGL